MFQLYRVEIHATQGMPPKAEEAAIDAPIKYRIQQPMYIRNGFFTSAKFIMLKISHGIPQNKLPNPHQILSLNAAIRIIMKVTRAPIPPNTIKSNPSVSMFLIS